MATVISIKDEQDTTDLLTYTQIQLERAPTLSGAYVLVASLTLVAGQVYYTYNDASGTLNNWYRYRLHNPTGPVDSSYSNSFQPDGVTRLKLRQAALSNHRAGRVLYAAASGQAPGVAAFTSYQMLSTDYRADRGKGTYLYPTTGANAGIGTRIASSNPVVNPALYTISPAWTNPLSTNDEVEWHWLTDPDSWNDAINRGLSRYYYLDRIPIFGPSSNYGEISLASLPWLTSRSQAFGLWAYQDTSSPETAWGTGGRWWGLREEGGVLTFESSPGLATGDTVYLEVLRPMPSVYTDADVLPAVCDLQYAAALAYDEVLSNLADPGPGVASVDRDIWVKARSGFMPKLRALTRANVPRPRYQPQQFNQRESVPTPFRAR